MGPLAAATLLFLLSPVAFAAGAVSEPPRCARLGEIASLRGAEARVRLVDVPLEGRLVELDLERFEVFTPDAWVDVHTDDGRRRGVRPSTRYYRGRIEGEPESLAFVAVDGMTDGFVQSRGRTYAIGAPVGDRAEPKIPVVQSNVLAGACREPEERGLSTAIPVPGFVSSGVTYDIRVAVETDHELYAILGSEQALTAYVGRLFGAASAIYNRDVQANLRVGYVGAWTTAADPWSDAPSLTGKLAEFENYWHSNMSGVNRNLAHFLSGRQLGSIAEFANLCRPDYDLGNGDWSGSYSFSGSVLGRFSTNVPLYYYDLLVTCHEIGHLCNSLHTHCYTPPIDKCYSGEGACYVGPTTVPPGGGTIMSYCDSFGWDAMTLTLGRRGEPSQAVLDTIRSFIESKASCLTVAGSCTYVVIPGSANYPASGGSGGVTITADPSCPWAGTSDSPFVTFTSDNLGSGSATVSYSVAANTEPNPRTATLTIAGQPVVITQGVPACTTGESSMCLNGNRFRVSVAWTNPYDGGSTGVGTASKLTSDTGSFWFFSPNNIELVVKVLDGRGTNGKFWVFYGALSDVAYTITVTDTLTGAVKTYLNEARHLASVADTTAF